MSLVLPVAVLAVASPLAMTRKISAEFVVAVVVAAVAADAGEASTRC